MIPFRHFIPCLIAATTVTPTAFAGIIVDVDFEFLQPRIGDADGLDDGDRIQDVSGNGYHGLWSGGSNDVPIVATGSGTAIDNTLKAGKILLRDGLTGIPDAWDGPTTTVSPYFTFDGSKSYTFEAVVNWNHTTSGLNGLMGQTTGNEMWLRESGGFIQYAFVSGVANANLFTNVIDVSTAKNDGQWHVISVVYDATAKQIRTYLDGTLKHTNTDADIGSLGTMVDGTKDFSLGGYNATASNYFNGIQDRYRISDVALDPVNFLTKPVLVAGDAITWTGGTDGTWDTSTAGNWKLDAGGAPVLFAGNDDVTFDENGANPLLTLVGTVSPATISVISDTVDYTFSGGTLGGNGVLEKSGASTLTLAGPVSRTGLTNLTEGALVIGDGATSGDAMTGPITLATGTSLRVSRDNTLDYSTSSRLQELSGGGAFVLGGGGRLIVNPGSGTSFDEAMSWKGLSGGVTVLGNSELQTLRNGRSAMGSGTVTLGDASTSGAISQYNGSWTWTSDIAVVGPANAIRNRSSNAFARILKLQGIIAGSGGLIFEDPSGSMTDNQTGYILTGANTLNGTVTINSGVPVRVGGVPGDTTVVAKGPGAAGSLGTATIIDNGALTFSRTDAHTVANTISGSGSLFVGLTTGSEMQVVDLTGTVTNDGDTTVRSGTLLINGSHGSTDPGVFSRLEVLAGATLGGAGDTTSDIYLAGNLAPGNTTGTLSSTGWLTLDGGSSYTWELGLWTGGTAGTDSDLVIADEIYIDSTAAPATPITIKVVPDSLTGFAETPQTFVIAQATTGLVDFDADAFTIDDSAFVAATGATGSWDVQQNGTNIELVYTAGSGLSGYALWINGFYPGQSNPAIIGINADPDKDGVPNGIEMLLGGSPAVANDVVLPTPAAGGNNLVLSFERHDQAIGVLSVIVQTSTDLANWPTGAEIVIGKTSSAGVAITDNGATDSVVITIPKSGAAAKFARLKVTAL